MSKLKPTRAGPDDPNDREQLVDQLISGVWQKRLVSQPTRTTVSYALSRGGGGDGGGHESAAEGPSGRGAAAVAGRTQLPAPPVVTETVLLTSATFKSSLSK